MDGKNRFRSINIRGSKKTHQTGYYERILCSDCERVLSLYETHFSSYWMRSIPSDLKRIVNNPHGDIIQVEIDEYEKFKLFHLSVFWRASISHGFKSDKDITLGKYERIIGDMILHGDSGKPGDFPLWGTLKINKFFRPDPTIVPLVHAKDRFDHKHHYYMMSYAYCDWILVIAQPGPSWAQDLESHFMKNNLILLQTVPSNQSKSMKFVNDARKILLQ